MKKKILIISFSNLKSDPRVRREIFFLKDNFEVTAAGYADPSIENVNFIALDRDISKLRLLFTSVKKLLRMHEHFYWNQKNVKSALKGLANKKFDLVIANDIDTVPLIVRLFRDQSRIIFDAHEYSPMEHSNMFVWNLLFKSYNNYLVKTYAHRCDRMLTVCEGIAELYQQNYQLSPVVITNAANYTETSYSSCPEGEKIRMIHHGYAHPSRKIENMITLMDHVDDRFELDLVLVFSKKKYYRKIKEMCNSRKNIRLLDPIPMQELIGFSAKYCIGLYLLESVNINNSLALPNKFFEFIQSRLAIAIGPSTEMARLVKAHQLGIVSADFKPETLANELNKLTSADINKFRDNTSRASRILSSETNKQVLNSLVNDLIGQ